jgi:hypothetical protein
VIAPGNQTFNTKAGGWMDTDGGGGGFGLQTLQGVTPSRSFWQASDASSGGLSGK